MNQNQEQKKAENIRVNVIIGRGMYKKFRASIALKGVSVTAWMKGKMAEEIERVEASPV